MNRWDGYSNYGNELYHHGILGQKWGVRRYQNEDGSLTEEGKRRYSSYTDSHGKTKYVKRSKKEIEDYDKKQAYANSPEGKAFKSILADEKFSDLVAKYHSGEYDWDEVYKELYDHANKYFDKYFGQKPGINGYSDLAEKIVDWVTY